MNGWFWAGLASLLMLSLVSSLEFALRSQSRARLAAFFEEQGMGDKLDRFHRYRSRFTSSCSVLRLLLLLSGVACAVLGGVDLSLVGEKSAAPAVALCLALLVFDVAVPHAVAKYMGDRLLSSHLWFLELIRWVVWPLQAVIEVIDSLTRRLAGLPAHDHRTYADELEQEILNVVNEGELHGAVDQDEAQMIESVIELSDTRVDAIMTPRTQIVALPVESDLDVVMEAIRSKGHSRIPVYDVTIDTVVGVLYAKDLLRRRVNEPFHLGALSRRTLFIPESKLVRDLLREFQAQKLHIAVVLDEYGGTAGLVTIEDILEELVGEITDEYDSTAPHELKRIDEFTVEVDARMKISEVNEKVGVQFPEHEDYETLGGYVFSHLGKIPIVGESFEHDNVSLHVMAAEPRRITRLRLTVLPAATSGASAAT